MRNALLLLLALASGAAVADEGNGLELTAFGGYRMGGSVAAEDDGIDIRLRDSSSAGLLLNGRHRDNTQWEVHYSNQQTSARISDALSGAESVVDFDSNTLQLGGTYLFEGEKVIPYLAFTLGGTHVRTRGAEDESDTFFSGSIGLGLRLLPYSRVGIRLEARAYGTLVNDSSQIFCSTGPDANVCAIRLKGDIVGQVETFAGITVRF